MELRRAARLIILDPKGQVLLFQHARSTGELFWATPGGGVVQGETFEAAAAREATEELGLEHLELKPLWDGTAEFVFGDRPVYQQERFFLAQIPRYDLTDRVRMVHQQERIMQVRWWSVVEIERTQELVFPRDLSIHLKNLKGGSFP